MTDQDTRNPVATDTPPLRPIERAIQTSNNCATDTKALSVRLNTFLTRIYQLDATIGVPGHDAVKVSEEEKPELHKLQDNIDQTKYGLEELSDIIAALECL